MTELKIGDKVAAMYLGHKRENPVLYTGVVKNVTETRVSIYPESHTHAEFGRWCGRKDSDGRFYVIAPKSRVLSIEMTICG